MQVSKSVGRVIVEFVSEDCFGDPLLEIHYQGDKFCVKPCDEWGFGVSSTNGVGAIPQDDGDMWVMKAGDLEHMGDDGAKGLASKMIDESKEQMTDKLEAGEKCKCDWCDNRSQLTLGDSWDIWGRRGVQVFKNIHQIQHLCLKCFKEEQGEKFFEEWGWDAESMGVDEPYTEETLNEFHSRVLADEAR